jgi:RHS repeat-associated protein
VAADGQVDFYNGSSGTVQLVADVSGWFAAGQPVPGSGRSYLHDADGRLLAVVDPGSDAYIYRYDGAGNILSVAHQPSGLSVLRVSPLTARPGQTVHVFGSGFSRTPAQDTVTIGGQETDTPKVVSPVQLDVVMPATSSGGIVAVAAEKSVASWAQLLQLAAGPPAIVSVVASDPAQPGTLVVNPGTALTIRGANFSTVPTDNRVTIGQVFASVQSATSQQLIVSLPTDASFTGALTVATPSGTAQGPDIFTVPSSLVGTTSFPIHMRLTSGQQSAVTLQDSTESALLAIDGQAKQRLSMVLGAGTIESGAVSLYEPGGAPVELNFSPGAAGPTTSIPFGTNPGIAFVATLPRNGTYLLAVNPGDVGGSVPITVTVFDEQPGVIQANGTAVTADITTPGTRALFSFTVPSGRDYTVQFSGNTFAGGSDFASDMLYLVDPTGQPRGLGVPLNSSSADGLFIPGYLQAGTYQVVVDPSLTGDLGSVTLQLTSVADLTGSITPNGPSVVTNIVATGQRALYSFTGTAGQRASVSVTASTFANDSDQVKLLDPTGNTITSAVLSNPTAFVSPVTLPGTGTYQVLVDPSQAGETGSATLELYTFADQTGTVTPNGPAVAATVNVPEGQRVIYSFAGTAGQRASVRITANSFPSDSDQAEMLDPDGNIVGSVSLGTPTAFVSAATLQSTGTYKLIVDTTQTGDTGSATLQLYTFADQTGTVTPNGPAVAATVNVAEGQRVIYSFAGTAGQRASVRVTASTFASSSDQVRLLDPNGNTIGSVSLGTPTAFVSATTLPSTGSYEIMVDPSQTGNSGSATLQLYSFADQTAQITPNGPPVTATVSVPEGQRVIYSFAGTAGQRVNAQVTASSFPTGTDQLELLGPSGNILGAASLVANSIISGVTLTTTGTYEVAVDASRSGDTGSATVQLTYVSDVTGPITPNGPTVTATIGIPGQRAVYTFAGADGQRASVRVTNSTFSGGSDQVRLLDPSGATVGSVSLGTPRAFVAALTLPATGTYKVVIDPSQAGDTGTATLQLYTFADQTAPITANAAPVTATVSVPEGQRVIYSFAGTVGQRTSLRVANSTFSGGFDQVELLDPMGNTLASVSLGTSTTFLPALSLPGTGTYKVAVDPSQSGDTGSATLQLYTFVDQTAPITPNGSPATATVSVPEGQRVIYTFAGTAGQRASLRVTASTFPRGTDQTALIDPSGNTLGSAPLAAGAFVSAVSLPVTGTYEVVLDPSQSGDTGSATLQLYLFADQTAPITPNAAAVTATVSVPEGQRVVYSFAGALGQRTSVRVTSNNFQSGSDHVQLVDPTGKILRSIPLGVAFSFLSPVTLLATGTYEVVLDPSQSGDTGSATLQLYLFTDQTAPITPSGSPVTATVSVPEGQRVIYSFAGTAGQRASVRATANTFGSDQVELLDPSGKTLTSAPLNLPGAFVSPVTLPSNGTYEVVVDPSQSGDTGSATLQLYVFADQAAPITPNGSPVTATVSVPEGQRVIYSFTGTAGQRASVRTTASTFDFDQLQLRDAGGNIMSSALLDLAGGTGGGQYVPAVTLPTTGTYEVVVDPSQSGDTGSATLQLYVFADQAAPITPNGSPVTATVSVPEGQRVIYSFTVPSAEQVTVAFSGNTFADAAFNDTLYLVDPTGEHLGLANLRGTTGTLGPLSLSVAGSYQVVVDPSAFGDTGSVTLGLTSTPVPSASRRPLEPLSDPMSSSPSNATTSSIGQPARPLTQFSASRTATGETLSGLVLKIDGHGLPGVTLSIGTHRVTSDQLGRFTIHGLKAGQQLLHIDGSTATGKGEWGFYSEVVHLVAGFPNKMPAVIWMTPLDNSHAVAIPYPIRQPLVVTTPKLPGLDLYIPAGTIIRDRNGAIVRSISITPVPVDKPPFPLPMDARLPIYFTIQPGGATIQGSGVHLIYPNWGHQPPGSRMTFWAYGAAWDGWWVYGHGTVTPDGRQVVPDPGTNVRDFSGAMFNSGPPPPSNAPGPCPCHAGDPIDLSSGLFTLSRTDISLPDVMPVNLTRMYRNNDPSNYRFGIGTNDQYGINLYSGSLVTSGQWLDVSLVLPDGEQIKYNRSDPDTSWDDAEFSEVGHPGPFSGSFITWNGNGWNLTTKDGTTYVFGDVAPLQAIIDRFGNEITISHSGDQSGPITDIVSPNGRWIEFTYNGDGDVSQAVDNSGRQTSYQYNSNDQLIAVTDVRGNTEQYAYDSAGNMTTVTDPLGHIVTTNTYNPDGTVASQMGPGSGTISFHYSYDSTRRLTSTRVTDQRGAVEALTFDAEQWPLTDTLATGTPLQRTWTDTYDPVSNVVTKETDPLGRSTAYGYDGLGNLTEVTQMVGTSQARTTRYSYEPVYGRLNSVTDALGNVTRADYTDKLDVSTEVITDPTGRTITVGVQDGLPVRVVDGLGNATTFGYDSGDLVTSTDPNSNTTLVFSGPSGLSRVITSPLGEVTTLTYDSVGNPTSETDPTGHTDTAAYDAAGNLTSFSDGNGHMTRYTYDDLYRPVSETDPLGNEQAVVYDSAGDPTTYIDQNGTHDRASYDLLGQLTSISWGVSGTVPQSTTNYSYDGVGRLLSASDTGHGTVTDTYDAFGNVTSEKEPSGTVNYRLDADDRRTLMTAGNAAPVGYTYDAAGRTLTVSTGGATSTITYDAAGRLSTIKDPGGILETRTYDAASNTRQISSTSSSPLSLDYRYDSDNQQTVASTSGVQPPPPLMIPSTTYNANNELVAFNNQRLTYDKDGSLLNDGTNTYSWDDQQNLTNVTSGNGVTQIATDPFGRVSQTTVSGSSATSYIEDGSGLASATNSTGSTSYATDPSSGRTLLEVVPGDTVSLTADALGSTTQVNDSAGNTLSSYAYDPFGTTAVTNPSAATNQVGYGGYAQVVSGLDNTAARYYSPNFGRFIAEDPVGLDGGQNLYTYAENDPIDWVDPSGLAAWRPTPNHIDMPKIGSPGWLEKLAQKVANSLRYPTTDVKHFKDYLDYVKAAARKGCGEAIDVVKPVLERGKDLGRAAGVLIPNVFDVIVKTPEMDKLFLPPAQRFSNNPQMVL